MKENKINYIFNTAYQILTVLTPLITAPYVSRVLGSEGIGTYSYTYSIVTYFVLLATLGSTTLGQREIAYAVKDEKKKSIVFWNLFIFRGLTTMLALGLYLFCIPFVYGKNQYVLPIIQSLYILNVGLDVTWYFQGIAKFTTITIRNTIVRFLQVILIFVLIKTENDLTKYIFLLAAGASIGFTVTLPLLRKEIKLVSLKDIKLLPILKKTLPLFVPTIAVQIYTVLDKTMIGLFAVSSSENGYYEQAEKIVKMTIVIITSLSTVLAPKIASAFKEEKKEEIIYYMRTMFSYVMIIGLPIMIGLIVISNSFVPLFLGNGYEKCIFLMKIFSPIVVFIGISNFVGNAFFVQTGKQKIVNISVITGALLNLCLNLILIPRFLSVGAAVASVIAEATVCMVQLFALNRIYSLKEIFSGNNIYFVASILMGALAYFVGEICCQVGGDNLLIVVAQVAIGSLTYFLILFVRRDRIIMAIIGNLFAKVKG